MHCDRAVRPQAGSWQTHKITHKRKISGAVAPVWQKDEPQLPALDQAFASSLSSLLGGSDIFAEQDTIKVFPLNDDGASSATPLPTVSLTQPFNGLEVSLSSAAHHPLSPTEGPTPATLLPDDARMKEMTRSFERELEPPLELFEGTLELFGESTLELSGETPSPSTDSSELFSFFNEPISPATTESSELRSVFSEPNSPSPDSSELSSPITPLPRPNLPGSPILRNELDTLEEPHFPLQPPYHHPPAPNPPHQPPQHLPAHHPQKSQPKRQQPKPQPHQPQPNHADPKPPSIKPPKKRQRKKRQQGGSENSNCAAPTVLLPTQMKLIRVQKALTTEFRCYEINAEGKVQDRWPCPVQGCSKADVNAGYTRISNVFKHYKQKHLNQKGIHTCDHCGKTFPRKDNYTRHLESLEAAKRWSCILCDTKAFADKANLKRHLRGPHQLTDEVEIEDKCMAGKSE